MKEAFKVALAIWLWVALIAGVVYVVVFLINTVPMLGIIALIIAAFLATVVVLWLVMNY